MRRRLRTGGVLARRTLLLAAAPLLASCGDGPADPGPPGVNGSTDLAVVAVASGLDDPLLLTAPSGDGRLFVIERPGRIRIIDDDQLQAAPFLDITDRVGSGGSEQGLLGLAFHPDYSTNGYFFVDYTDGNGDTRVARFSVTADPDVADPASETPILQVPQPASNHNGGMLAFAPDGTLYLGLGDGGGAGDPFENGQDLSTLLGSLLRIDVDAGVPYSVPSDNPFVGEPGARPEIWAYGLRNPWRFAFDRSAGYLYIGDVGQSSREEIDATAVTEAGRNYGWNVLEGTRCFQDLQCDSAGLTLPVLEYDHSEGCSVTGGFVYRGHEIPEILGHYFYSDFCSGFLRSFRLDSGQAVDRQRWEVGNLGAVASFGEDAAGELYVISLGGRVSRLVRAE